MKSNKNLIERFRDNKIIRSVAGWSLLAGTALVFSYGMGAVLEQIPRATGLNHDFGNYKGHAPSWMLYQHTDRYQNYLNFRERQRQSVDRNI